VSVKVADNEDVLKELLVHTLPRTLGSLCDR